MKKRIFALITAVLLIFSTSVVASAASVKSFDETIVEGTVSYSEAGSPIVDDPNALVENVEKAGVVTAITTEDTWMYTTKRLNTGVFIIPEGKAVVVLENDSNYGAAKVTYAGYTGWVYTSKLQLA